MLTDEVPDNDDYDAGRRRGEFDNITPEDFTRDHGSGRATPPGWLDGESLGRIRRQMPIAYVEVVPVRADEFGRVTQIGSLRRGEFDNITPEDFTRDHGSGRATPPGWLDGESLGRIRRQMPIAYVEVVPVRADEFGRVTQIGSLLRVCDDGRRSGRCCACATTVRLWSAR